MANMNAKFMKNAFIGWTDTAGLYYPPDFDPSKLVSEKKYSRDTRDKKGPKKPKMMNIRMMMPFSMICSTCGNFSYIGTKFNSRVEKVQNEAFYGCAIYRFYGKCQHCSSDFTFKTDPESADYVMESGGKRNYEAWKDADGAIESVEKNKEEEAENDAMKALEQASASAAAEMQIADALEELQHLNRRTKNHDDTIHKAIDFLYKKHATEDEPEVDDDNFEDELEAYRNEQLSRRNKLEDIEEQDVPATSSSASIDPAPAAKKPRIETSTMKAPPIRIKKRETPDAAATLASSAAVAPTASAPSSAPTRGVSASVAASPPLGPLLAGYDSQSSDDD